MNNFSRIIFLMTLALAIAACTGSAPQTNFEEAPSNVQAASGTQVPGENFQREMPQVLQLALGTFKLESTAYAIDAEQAAALLPLWKAARSLSQSETAATEEVNAIVKQIQETMTGEQIQAIQGMKLTMRDMGDIAEELGLEFAGEGGFGNIDPELRATMQAARESGQAPPDGFGGGVPGAGPGGGPGGGFGGGVPGGGPGGEGLSPEARQTAIAERGGFPGATLGLNTALLDALIEFLESKL